MSWCIVPAPCIEFWLLSLKKDSSISLFLLPEFLNGDFLCLANVELKSMSPCSCKNGRGGVLLPFLLKLKGFLSLFEGEISLFRTGLAEPPLPPPFNPSLEWMI
jgi:hypothetical protein